MGKPYFYCPHGCGPTSHETARMPSGVATTRAVCGICGWAERKWWENTPRRESVAVAQRMVAAANDHPGPERDLLDAHLCEARMTSFPPKTRTVIVLRDEGLCVRCGKAVAVCLDDRVRAVEQYSTHHRQMKGMGGRSVDHSTHNGITLCGSGSTGCHAWVHQHPDEAREQGWIVRWEDSPETVPVTVATSDGPVQMCLDGDIRFPLCPGCERCGDDGDLRRQNALLLCRRCRRETADEIGEQGGLL